MSINAFLKPGSGIGVLCLAASAGFLVSNVRGAAVIGGFNDARGGTFAIASGSALQTVRASILDKFPGTTFSGSGTITSTYLAGVDVLFLSSARAGNSAIAPLSADEKSALRAFVEQGGTAILLVDNDTFAGAASDAANESLIDPFGVDVTGTGLAWPQGATVLNPLAPPICSGPFGSTASWQVGWTGWFNGVPAEAVVLGTINQSTLPGLLYFPRHALAACSGGVVIFSDSTSFADGYFAPGSGADILMANSIAVALQPSCVAGQCGDIDGDGQVNGADLGILLAAWGTGDRSADLNADGVVNGADLGILLSNWGPCEG